jgi:hypothetical protein
MDEIEPSRQEVAARDRSAPRQVTGKLKAALDCMVWSGSKRSEAASHAGLTDHSLRAALKKPHVLAYYRSELAALRHSEQARSVHRLTELRDQDDNKQAAVHAIKTLEQLSDNDRPGGGFGPPTQPGLVIVVMQQAAPQPKPDGPLITVDSVGNDVGTPVARFRREENQ